LKKPQRKIDELAEYESQFREYAEGISSARAVIEDLGIAVRDFSSHLEFSPARPYFEVIEIVWRRSRGLSENTAIR